MIVDSDAISVSTLCFWISLPVNGLAIKRLKLLGLIPNASLVCRLAQISRHPMSTMIFVFMILTDWSLLCLSWNVFYFTYNFEFSAVNDRYSSSTYMLLLAMVQISKLSLRLSAFWINSRIIFSTLFIILMRIIML